MFKYITFKGGKSQRSTKKKNPKNEVSTYKRSTGNPGGNTRNTGDTGLTWGLQNNQTDDEKGLINKWNTGEQENGLEKDKGTSKNMTHEDRNSK